MDEHKTMAMKERELERLYGDELEQKSSRGVFGMAEKKAIGECDHGC